MSCRPPHPIPLVPPHLYFPHPFPTWSNVSLLLLPTPSSRVPLSCPCPGSPLPINKQRYQLPPTSERHYFFPVNRLVGFNFLLLVIIISSDSHTQAMHDATTALYFYTSFSGTVTFYVTFLFSFFVFCPLKQAITASCTATVYVRAWGESKCG